jgi:hypothetical protein
MLFWGSKWAWYFTAVMFLLNNTFIQGLHVLTISRYLNTMSGMLKSIYFTTAMY